MYWEVIENQSYTGSLLMDMMLFCIACFRLKFYHIFSHIYVCISYSNMTKMCP